MNDCNSPNSTASTAGSISRADVSHQTAGTETDWWHHCGDVQPRLEVLQRLPVKPWQLHVLRSSQLDAGRLDDELTFMLKEQFSHVFEHFKPGVVTAYDLELDALLQALVFGLSVWQGGATPGSTLMNLRYRNERKMHAEGGNHEAAGQALGGHSGVEGPPLDTWQRAAYGVAAVLLPYVCGRAGRHAAQQDWGHRDREDWRHRTWQFMRALDASYRAVSLLNLWVFLRDGKYRCVLERLLGARLVYAQPSMSRLVSFEYLSRQLVWRELADFLLFFLPLINVQRLRWFVAKWLPRPGPTPSAPEQGEDATTSPGMAQQAGPCPICGTTSILLPYLAHPCSHVFCYYCLRAHTQADRSFCCPLDGMRVAGLRRWRPP